MLEKWGRGLWNHLHMISSHLAVEVSGVFIYSEVYLNCHVSRRPQNCGKPYGKKHLGIASARDFDGARPDIRLND